ncbi:MAG: DNA methylase N-4/N-6 protein [Thermoplasmatales archaeon I-plasma]|jgi:DNA modification methylase|nr:MAG: DNA methylase N-4/N-6 protein [Thermoplasmatales archaeon I-plasma]
MVKDSKQSKVDDITLESVVDNIVGQEQEEGPNIEISEQKEFFKVPKRFGNVPVDELPLGYTKGREYRDKFPRIDLPFQKIEEISFGTPELEPNKLFWGDNLHIMRSLPSESIDLIYIDPPFFSGRNYNVIFGDQNEVRSFSDIWEDGMPGYLVWLNARLLEMKRLLKPTGSIYAHLDWHASHYVKVEMDKIFRYDNFQNEIIWKRHVMVSGASGGLKNFSQKTDSILFYSRNNNHNFNLQHRKSDDVDFLNGKFSKFEKETGRYFETQPLVLAGNEPSYLKFPDRELKLPLGKRFAWNQETLDENLKRNPLIIYWTKSGLPRYKKYLDEYEGEAISNLWDDINVITSTSNESIGYPTQKPETLLERIIRASSNEGDVVADFFCGGGTTPSVAQRLGRRWIASDISRIAVEITKGRILKLLKGEGQGWIVPERTPNIQVLSWGYYDIPSLSDLSQEEFEAFIVKAFGAQKISDPKISGLKNGIPVWVGPEDNNEFVTDDNVLDFAQYLNENYENRKRGIMVGWQFSEKAKQAKEMLAKLGAGIDFVTIDLVNIGSDAFREHVTSKHPEYETFLRFIMPPVVRLKIRKKVSLEYDFDFSESASLNNGKIINIQADFDYNKAFVPTSGYAFLSKGNPSSPLLVSYKFDSGGKKTVAFKVEDDQGGETMIVKEIEVE